jgi:hypothetical protein
MTTCGVKASTEMNGAASAIAAESQIRVCHDRVLTNSSFLDDEKRRNDLRGVGQHVRGCSTCREILAAAKNVLSELVRTHPAHQAPEALRTRVLGTPSSKSHAGSHADEPGTRTQCRMPLT